MLKVIAAALTSAALVALPVAATAQTAPAAKPAATQPDKSAKPKRAVSPGQAAMRERQKKCGAEWRDAKAAGKVEKGQTWPKFWSACNKRLKGA
ncbi:MAG: hypothetical protein KIT85_20120 [Pseudolabrys sp.]|nr:hypothetical protein [Pseudolabrys sp.]